MHPFQIDQYFIYPHYWNHTHLPMNKTHTCKSHASYLATHPSSQPMKEKWIITARNWYIPEVSDP